MSWLNEPWPWYIAGPFIGLMVPLLLIGANKHFGISSTWRHICAVCVPTKIPYFQYDWKPKTWSLLMAIGMVLGGFLASLTIPDNYVVDISHDTLRQLSALGVKDFKGLVPSDIFNWDNLISFQGIAFMLVGGFCVGFGSRYANGCTSGHAIMGLSLLNPASLVAVIGFFTGGLIMTYFIFPYLF